MIKATAISLVDQALLSAVNFGLALLLIRFAPQEQYGLYSQMIGLQALFSVLHAGLFVSAYLSMLPGQADAASGYQAAMARAEAAITLLSVIAVALVTWSMSLWMGHAIGWPVSITAALALLGLWWREFARARYFAQGRPWAVLRLDAGFALLLAGALALAWAYAGLSAASVLMCMGLAGVAIAALPLWRQAGLTSTSPSELRLQMGRSWLHARWEVLTSLATWTHAQTYVFFAALQGGLAAAAEISAGRLLTAPLALVWLSYANILRPEASRLLAARDSRSLRRLTLRSAGLVSALAVAFAILLKLALPLLDAWLFGGRFAHVGELAYLWLGYFTLTGMTTVATSLLRSAFEFKTLFKLHALCAMLACAASFAGLAWHTPLAFVVVLLMVEVILAASAWWLLHRQWGRRAPATLAADAVAH